MAVGDGEERGDVYVITSVSAGKQDPVDVEPQVESAVVELPALHPGIHPAVHPAERRSHAVLLPLVVLAFVIGVVAGLTIGLLVARSDRGTTESHTETRHGIVRTHSWL